MFAVESREFAVVVERGYFKIDTAVFGNVGVPVFDKLGNHVELFSDMLGGARLDRGAEHIEPVAIAMEFVLPFFCKVF